MYKTKRLPPYQENGHATFNKRNVCGTYLIYKKGVLRYVGFSSNNLYRTLYRHFQAWETQSQTRAVYKNLKDIKVCVVYTNNGVEAENLEKAIIIKKKPTDNEHKYKKYTTDKAENKAFNLYTGAPLVDIVINKRNNDENEPF